MLKIGDSAPEFSLPDAHGARESLASLLSRGPLLLYFYPADFTRICTRQSCMYRDSGAQLAAAGLHVAGISRQSSQSKSRFSEAFGLDFPLLADVDGTVSRAYGAWMLGGLVVRRIAYLISVKGVILSRVEANFSVSRQQKFLEESIRQVRDAKQ